MRGHGDMGAPAMLDQPWVKWALGAGALFLLFGRRSSSGGDMQSRWFGPNAVREDIILDLQSRLPARAQGWSDVIAQVAREEQVSPILIYGIGDWEGAHRWDPNQRNNDAGATAYSPFQINDRFHAAWLAQGLWSDPYQATKYAIGSILKPGYTGAIQAGYNGRWADDVAVASYNAGLGGALKGAREGDPQRYTYPSGRGTYLDNIYGGIQQLGYTL
jgi:hypothetical protein